MSAQAFGIARYVMAAYAENVPGDQYAPGNLANKIVEALYSAEKEDGYQLLLTGRIVAELYVMLMRSVSEKKGRPGTLYGEIRGMPAWGAKYQAADYIRPNPGVWHYCKSLDISPLVWQDLHFLRKSGNIAAHANTRIHNECRAKELADEARECICRIGLVSSVWIARLAQSKL